MLGGFFREVEMLEVEMQLVETHETVRVGADIKFEVVDDFRRDPSGAQFRSWKTRKIKNENIDAGLAQLPCAGRACRPTSDNQRVNFVHSRLAFDGFRRIQKLSVPWHIIVAVRRENDLIELQGAGLESG